MRHPLVLIAIVSVVTQGCNDRQQSPPASQPSATSQAYQQGTKVQDTTIPSDVSFSIIDSNTIPGIKRSLDIRLNKKVSESVLRAVALKLKAQDSQTYDRTFIVYYLPEMAVGAGAWATTHFNPDLKVRILGLTAEDETKLAAQPEPANREIIGRCLDESPHFGGRITIFREEGDVFMEKTFKDGSSLKQNIAERNSAQGRRFDKVEGASAGDHWIIGPDGNLQLRDNDGLISTSKRIQ